MYQLQSSSLCACNCTSTLQSYWRVWFNLHTQLSIHENLSTNVHFLYASCVHVCGFASLGFGKTVKCPFSCTMHWGDDVYV